MKYTLFWSKNVSRWMSTEISTWDWNPKHSQVLSIRSILNPKINNHHFSRNVIIWNFQYKSILYFFIKENLNFLTKNVYNPYLCTIVCSSVVTDHYRSQAFTSSVAPRSAVAMTAKSWTFYFDFAAPKKAASRNNVPNQLQWLHSVTKITFSRVQDQNMWYQ